VNVITNVRGEGLKPKKIFLGLELTGKRDVRLLRAVGNKAGEILDAIARAGRFDEEPESGISRSRMPSSWMKSRSRYE